MLQDLAEVSLFAGLRLAGIDTVVLFTGLISWAVFIPLTLPLNTFLIWISQKSRWTRTGVSAYTLPGTNGIGNTRVGNTWVWGLNTLLVLANKACFTVWIHLTFRLAASDGVWFRNKTFQASTDGIAKLILHTHCSGSTGGGVAGVWFFNTLLVSADISCVTVLVNNALWLAASDGVRVGNQTRLTSANWVSNGVNHANGTGTTR